MEKILLWPQGAPGFREDYGQPQPNLTLYRVEGEKKPAVILCPGGGYTHIGVKEGEPVARWLNSLGIQVFRLEYRFRPYTHEAVIGDIKRAVRLVRARAAEFGTDPERIGVMGFSAGGHLVGSACIYFDEPFEKLDAIDEVSGRPDAAVLCYSVLAAEPEADTDPVFRSLLGDQYSPELVDKYALDRHVRPDMPPVFMWHTLEDPVVPVYNSLRMAQALHDAGVPVELHLYPYGLHGMGLAEERTDGARDWTAACARWFGRLWNL